MHVYKPNDEGEITSVVSETDEVVSFSSPVSYGLYFGLRVKVPISQFDLVVKPEYKFGINSLYTGSEEIFNRHFRISIGLSMKEAKASHLTEL